MDSHNLPIQLTSLVGREQEMATLRQLLDRPNLRLVTITGPFGVGKTSLSLAVAHASLDTFADGVFLVSLAAISDQTLIIPTIAQTLNVSESPHRLSIDVLKDYLHNREMLLVLDNFEQIITAAPLLSELLSVCAGLKLLVTSREPLRLRGEQVFQLSPLALPGQSAVQGLLHYPSIALFVERAQAAKFDFQLTDQNRTAVAELCVQLDGLPLAIELAAARIRLLPPQTMLEQLQKSSLQLLRGGARDLPDRHQTMRQAVRWSYDLLAEEEQYALRWLSVFVGGCTLEAAISVLGPTTAIDTLDSLVGKSLLRQTEVSGAPRFTMLEAIREFGWEQLASTGELPAARCAHADNYLSFAEEAAQGLAGADKKSWLQQLDLEQDNLRAALQWAIDQQEAELAQRLAGTMQPYWFARGFWSEGRRWLEASLAIISAGQVNQAVRAWALYGEGKLARFQGDFAYARSLCEKSLALYRDLNDPAGEIEALAQLCRITAFQRDQAATEFYLAEVAAMINTLPDSAVKANAYTDMAIALVGADKVQPSVEIDRYLAESERIHRAQNNQSGLAFTLIHLANQARYAGDYRQSAAHYDEAEQLLNELGDSHLLSRMAMSRLSLDIVLGDFSAARNRGDIALQEGLKRGDHHLPIGLPLMAAVLQGQGQSVWAARVLGMAEAMFLTPEQREEAAVYEQYLQIHHTRETVRSQLGDDAFAREIVTGRRLKLDDLLAIPHPPESSPAGESASSTTGAGLTVRESEVLHLLAEELSNPQIAERLVVSRRTVDAHLRSIYDKLDVKSRDAAVRVGRERGILGI